MPASPNLEPLASSSSPRPSSPPLRTAGFTPPGDPLPGEGDRCDSTQTKPSSKSSPKSSPPFTGTNGWGTSSSSRVPSSSPPRGIYYGGPQSNGILEKLLVLTCLTSLLTNLLTLLVVIGMLVMGILVIRE